MGTPIRTILDDLDKSELENQINASISNLQTQIDEIEVTIPVKGTHYWTPADQESIVQQVIAALGTPVFGTVDEDNNIILSGELADGTYTVKYEDGEGNVVDIGALNQTHGPSYTNQIPISIDTDGSIYNGKGWIENQRLNSSGLVKSVDAYGYTGVTGFIPIAEGDIIRTSANIIVPTGSTQQCVCFYDANKAFLTRMQYSTSASHGFGWDLFTINADNSFIYKHGDGYFATNTQNAAYVRFCLAGITDGTIITKNEEIV